MAQQERRVVEGLALIVPKGTDALTRQRMAHLHPTAAKWHCTNSTSGRMRSRRWIPAIAAIWQHGWCVPSMKGWRAIVSRNRLRAFAAFCRKRRSWCFRRR